MVNSSSHHDHQQRGYASHRDNWIYIHVFSPNWFHWVWLRKLYKQKQKYQRLVHLEWFQSCLHTCWRDVVQNCNDTKDMDLLFQHYFLRYDWTRIIKCPPVLSSMVQTGNFRVLSEQLWSVLCLPSFLLDMRCITSELLDVWRHHHRWIEHHSISNLQSWRSQSMWSNLPIWLLLILSNQNL